MNLNVFIVMGALFFGTLSLADSIPCNQFKGSYMLAERCQGELYGSDMKGKKICTQGKAGQEAELTDIEVKDANISGESPALKITTIDGSYIVDGTDYYNEIISDENGMLWTPRKIRTHSIAACYKYDSIIIESEGGRYYKRIKFSFLKNGMLLKESITRDTYKKMSTYSDETLQKLKIIHGK